MMAPGDNARGVFVIASTPFHPDGKIDETSADRMTDFFVECGTTGITVLGQMGEAPKLDHQEALSVASRIIKRANIPIIVGVSSPGFAAMRSLTLAVMEDYPLTFTVVMTPNVIRRIVAENPSCFMLKHEDWPGLEKISALRNFEREGTMRHISILCGNGGLFLDFETERGADGAMTGYCFPDMLVDVVRLTRTAQRDAAHDLFDAHLPLIRYEQQPGIGLAVRKYVLMSRGILASDTQRRPATSLSKAARDEVNYLLRRLARHDERARLTSLQEPH